MRLKEICSKIRVRHSWVEYPKATLITPAIRPHFIARTIEQYEKQTYSNKELVIVINGCVDDYPKLPEGYFGREDIQLVYVPNELNAGACMKVPEI